MKEKAIQFCTQDEIADLINGDNRLVYIDDGYFETIGKYEDLPDIIVDLSLNFGVNKLNVYDYDKGNSELLLSTFGPFLNKCNSQVRKDIIERLEKLQKGTIKIKEYNLIDEVDLNEYFEFLDGGIDYARNE